ncbi:MAG: carbohydrate-binding domain-containing protein, partial [Clostridia bacterium]|nr:carbohydrate-binding domain-containing protein [Clostridia bacterium]
MYKLLYVSVDETGNAASSYVLESRMWDSIHLLAELTSPEKPMMLVQEGEILYACIGYTAYWLPQWKEPEENTVSILAEGTYLLTGTLSDGMILVDAPDADVRLILADADVTHTTGAALYIREAKNVYLTLEAGSENRLAAAGEFEQIDTSNIDGALFSKSDLICGGTGSLTVTSASGHGIVSKDDLEFVDGRYTVEAAGQGIAGKDSVTILDGTFMLTAGKDGIHSEQEDTEKGNVRLEGGTYTIRAAGDGISASGTLSVSGGTYDIFTGNGSASVTHAGEENWMGGGRMPERTGRGDMPGGMEMPDGIVPGGMPGEMGIPERMEPGEMPGEMVMPDGMEPGEMPGGMGIPGGMIPDGRGGFGGQNIQDAVPEGSTVKDGAAAGTTAVDSSKGLKAGKALVVSGGTFVMDTADDALHSNGDLSVAEGTFTLASGDDGFHGDGHVEISGGTIAITKSYEGIEGHTIHIAGGEITLQAEDDGMNAAGGNDGSGNMGFFGMDAFAADENAGITISGGTL